MLSEALQRNAKHEARLSNISDLVFEERPRKDLRIESPGLAPKAFGAALQLRFAQNDITMWHVNDCAAVRLGFA